MQKVHCGSQCLTKIVIFVLCRFIWTRNTWQNWINLANYLTCMMTSVDVYDGVRSNWSNLASESGPNKPLEVKMTIFTNILGQKYTFCPKTKFQNSDNHAMG